MRHLLDQTDARGAEQSARLLRYRDGQPITSRRYDYLWTRIKQQLPWAAAQQASTTMPSSDVIVSGRVSPRELISDPAAEIYHQLEARMS